MTGADPFGLWELPPARSTGELSYQPGAEAPEEAAAIWSLDLAQAGPELDRRAQTLTGIETGLDEANLRLERFLASRGATGEQVSYAAGPNAENLLLLALTEVDPQRYAAPGALSYGWQDLVKWEEMRTRFQQFADMMNRHFSQFVWVDTNDSGRLIARTKINWTSNLNAYWMAGIASQQVATHKQSLELAVRTRAANLRLYLNVIQMALRIARAVSTPLGVLDALGLAWQFVQDVIMPMLNEIQPAQLSTG